MYVEDFFLVLIRNRVFSVIKGMPDEFKVLSQNIIMEYIVQKLINVESSINFTYQNKSNI